MDDEEQPDTAGTAAPPAEENTTPQAAGGLNLEQAAGGDDIGKQPAITLDSVKDALDYGRQSHGLGGGGGERPADGGGMDMSNLPESQNVDDRRGEYGEGGPGKIMRRLRDNKAGNNSIYRYAEGGSVQDDDLQGRTDESQVGLPGEDFYREQNEGLQKEMQQVPMPQRRPVPQGPQDDPERIRKAGEPKKETFYGGESPGQMVRSGAKRIMAYLQGADAMPPERVEELEQKADPDGSMDEGQRKIATIDAASKEGGPEAAWRVMQKYRKNYDTYRAHAAGALSHGDLRMAAESASKAYPNVPDGLSLQFAPTQGGVTAAVMQGSKPVDQFQLTVPQFNQWLQGNEGQYDHVMEVGAPKLLKSIAAGQGTPVQQVQTPTQQQNRMTQGIAQPRQQAPQPDALPPTDQSDLRPFAAPGVAQQQPGKYRPTPAGYQSQEPEESGYDAGDEKASRAMFPSIGQNGQRTGWLEGQKQQREKNRIEMAKAQREYVTTAAQIKANGGVEQSHVRAEGGERREIVKQTGEQGRADTRAGAYNKRTESTERIKMNEHDTRLKAAALKAAGQNQDTQLKAAGQLVGKETANVPFGTPLSPEAVAARDLIYRKLNIQAPAAPSAPQQGAPGTSQKAAFKPGPGWQHSAATGMYRDPQGKVYDKDGNPAQ